MTVAALALVLGCNNLSVNTNPPDTIEISPPSAYMLANTSGRFSATAYDSEGNEVAFLPASWQPYVRDFGVATDTGVDEDGAYCVFKPTGIGTGELRCFYNDIVGIATITASATIGVVTVSPHPLKMNVNKYQAFTATATDIDGKEITLFIPTWEVLGAIGTIVSTLNNVATFYSTGEGVGTIEAWVQGVSGESTVTVTSEVI